MSAELHPYSLIRKNKFLELQKTEEGVKRIVFSIDLRQKRDFDSMIAILLAAINSSDLEERRVDPQTLRRILDDIFANSQS